MKCISIPECTQRLSHLTTLGGQHGQESEEGEEGEERSEEDCEEDPQGRQEEVSSLELAAGAFVAGTSFGANRVDLNSIRKAPRDAKRVSARHQVKRLDRTFRKRSRFQSRSGRRKQNFLRTVRTA